MKLKDFLDNPEEIFIGAVLQFPLIFVIGWWVLPLMLVSGILWRIGGTAGGNKLFRRIGVPLLVCGSSAIALKSFGVLLAIPFMIWVAPSYGKESFLYKFFLNFGERKADVLTRVMTYIWYWTAYILAVMIPF